MIYQIKDNIELRISIKDAWEFFSNPQNLNLITPPELKLKITSDSSSVIYPGQMITYVVRPLLGIPLKWITEITHVDKEKYFVDEQRYGPYKIWHHEHHFTATSRGVLVQDHVAYMMPLGFLGDLAHLLHVGKELSKIFDYRRKVLSVLFQGET